MNEEAIIRKLNEITQFLQMLSNNSKPIHQLPEVEGDELWAAASNGEITGKKKIENFQMPDLTIPYRWHNTNLELGGSITISNENLNFNLLPVSTNTLKGFNGEGVADGIIGNIRNGGDQPILIKNNFTEEGVSIPFFLSSQTDYNLQPNEILSYKYSAERNQAEITVYSEASFQRLRKVSETHSLTPEQIEQPTFIIQLEQNPNMEEFPDVYVNGILINPLSYVVDENLIIIDKSKVAYSFSSGMKLIVIYRY